MLCIQTQVYLVHLVIAGLCQWVYTHCVYLPSCNFTGSELHFCGPTSLSVLVQFFHQSCTHSSLILPPHLVCSKHLHIFAASFFKHLSFLIFFYFLSQPHVFVVFLPSPSSNFSLPTISLLYHHLKISISLIILFFIVD